MSDPLGFISRSNAAASPFTLQNDAAQRTDPSQPSFKDVLLENINQVNKLQQDATKAVEDLQTGKRNDVEGVLLATQKADTAFRLLVQLRNKVQQAADEIKQLRV